MLGALRSGQTMKGIKMVLATLGAAAGSIAMNYWSQKNAAKQNLSAQKQLSTMNFNQQKYFAQNAHQMEMEDLKKAGLNPALTATGGNGASASGGGIPGPQGIQPIDVLNGMKTLIDARNQTSATQSQNELNRAQALNTIANTENIPYQNKIGIINALAAQTTAEAATTNAEANIINANSNQEVNTEKTKNLRRERGYIGFFPHTSASGYTEYKFYNPKNTKQYLIQGKY